jgi:hypothetical protein
MVPIRVPRLSPGMATRSELGRACCSAPLAALAPLGVAIVLRAWGGGEPAAPAGTLDCGAPGWHDWDVEHVVLVAEAAAAAGPTTVVADVVEAEAAIACAPLPAVAPAWRAVFDCGKKEATPTSMRANASPPTAPAKKPLPLIPPVI